MIRIALLIALATGIADVAIALLQRPFGFSSLSTLSGPVAAATVLVFVICVAIEWTARRLVPRVTTLALAAGVSSFVGSSIVIGLLGGVQEQWALNPHTAFKVAAAGGLGVIVGAGVYALFVTALASGRSMLGRILGAVGAALPVLLLEVLLAEWATVYLVDSIASLAGALVVVALAVAVIATLAAFVSSASMRAIDWSLGTCALILLLLPVASWAWSDTSPGGAEAAVTRRPNHIILITVDTLRADGVSAYRPDDAKGRITASMDGLAQDGVRFEHAFAPAPWTLPSLTSMMTGLSPHVHQVADFSGRLSDSATTLAERLRARGYRTAAFLHNDVLGPERNLTQGFDEYHSLHQPWFAESIGATLLQRTVPALFPPTSWPTTADETGLILDWLEANHDRDFFLWMHYLDPHAPYSPPAQYVAGTPPPGIGLEFEGQKLMVEGQPIPTVPQRRWVRALYDSEVQYVDASLGRVLGDLKRLGVYDDSLIVLTSDHGEEFWEHGALGHGHTMYLELLKVPLVVKLPGAREKGTRAPLVTTVSVTPTILDLAGLPYNAHDVSAPSLAPLLAAAPAPVEPQPVFTAAQMLFDVREAVRFDHYRYIVSTVDGHEELYDLDRDPGERRSLAFDMPDLLKKGAELLQQERVASAQLGKRLGIEKTTQDMDTEVVRRLRTLGYVK